MAIDSKGNNHQPKGTPNAGRFVPKAGAGDDDDLHEDSFPGMYRPRCMPGNWLGGGFAPPTKDGFDVDPYMRSDAGGVRADADDMAEFRKALPVRPMAMSDREYGEAATVEDGVLRLYSGNTPRIPLLEARLEEGEDPRSAAYRGLWRGESCSNGLPTTAPDAASLMCCPRPAAWMTTPSACPPGTAVTLKSGSTGTPLKSSRMTKTVSEA